MIKYSNYLLMIFSLAFLFACNDDDVDTTPPVISNYSLNGQTTTEVKVAPGGQLIFAATFTDNTALKSYQIEIHDDFDDHSHGRAAAGWEYKNDFSLSGARQEASQTLQVPADAAKGKYHFIVNYFDAEGNEGEMLELDFEIVDIP